MVKQKENLKHGRRKRFNRGCKKSLKESVRKYRSFVEEYVKDDAAIACLVWEKQKEILERRGTLEPVLRDFKMIPILLMMKQNGSPIDREEKEKVTSVLTRYIR